jgi:hypothetical protein
VAKEEETLSFATPEIAGELRDILTGERIKFTEEKAVVLISKFLSK